MVMRSLRMLWHVALAHAPRICSHRDYRRPDDVNDNAGGARLQLAMGGLVIMMHLTLDFKTIVLGKHHFLLYALACSIRPRMLVTLDEDLKPLPVTVRVGQAVDVVGLAGRPKKITGFQTHTTPVLLASGERAELATDEYLPLTSILDGIVVLTKNPGNVTQKNWQRRWGSWKALSFLFYRMLP